MRTVPTPCVARCGAGRGRRRRRQLAIVPLLYFCSADVHLPMRHFLLHRLWQARRRRSSCMRGRPNPSQFFLLLFPSMAVGDHGGGGVPSGGYGRRHSGGQGARKPWRVESGADFLRCYAAPCVYAGTSSCSIYRTACGSVDFWHGLPQSGGALQRAIPRPLGQFKDQPTVNRGQT